MFGRGDGDLEPIRSDAMRSDANRNVRESSRTPARRPAEKPAAPARGVPRPVLPPVPPPGAEELKPVPLGKASDEELMRRTQTEDKQAFELLYERYSASVLSYLYRMLGNLEDVESIGQEVFLRAFRFRTTYHYPHKFSTWLFTITRNLAINQSRRRKESDPQHHRAQSGRD